MGALVVCSIMICYLLQHSREQGNAVTQHEHLKSGKPGYVASKYTQQKQYKNDRPKATGLHPMSGQARQDKPMSMPDSRGNNGSMVDRPYCKFCRRKGHWTKDCRRLKSTLSQEQTNSQQNHW